MLLLNKKKCMNKKIRFLTKDICFFFSFLDEDVVIVPLKFFFLSYYYCFYSMNYAANNKLFCFQNKKSHE